jgi:hypothetical protein
VEQESNGGEHQSAVDSTNDIINCTAHPEESTLKAFRANSDWFEQKTVRKIMESNFIVILNFFMKNKYDFLVKILLKIESGNLVEFFGRPAKAKLLIIWF